MRRRLATLALLLFVTGALAAAAAAEVVQSGNVRVTFHAAFSPHALPRERPAPISVEVDGKISTTDGSQPPPLQTLRLELSSAGQIDTVGLPACRASELQSTSSETALQRCGPAQVGRGSFEAQLRFSGRPILVDGRALVFNGLVGGRPGMFIHIYIAHPVTVTLVIPLKISHGERALRHGADDAGAETRGRLRLDHRAAAADRPPLLLPRPTPQLPERRLRRPGWLPRRHLHLRPRGLRLRRRAHDARLPSRAVKFGTRENRGTRYPSTQPKGRTQMNQIDLKLRRLGALFAAVAAIGGGALLAGCGGGGDSTGGSSGNVSEEISTTGNNAQKEAEEGVEAAERGIEEGKEKAEEGLEEAKEKLENSKGQSKKSFEEAKEKAEEGIEEAKEKAEELLP